MPTVDFTLSDIDALIDRKLDEKLEKFEIKIENRFAKERTYTRQIVRDEVQQSEHRIVAQFNSFIEHNFDPAIDSLQGQIDSLHGQVNGIKTDVQDIKRQLRGPRLV